MLLPLLFLVVIAPAPLLAIVVLASRVRGAVRRDGAGALATRAVAAIRRGTARPVWPGLTAVVVATAALTALFEQAYLATVTQGPRLGFDVALLGITLGLVAMIVCALLSAAGAAAVARARGFAAGTVAGVLALVAVAAGAALAHLPLRAAYLADPGGFPLVPNLADGDLLIPVEAFLFLLTLALPWPVLGAALRTGSPRRRVRDGWQLLLDLATADLPAGRTAWGAALRAELAVIDAPAERRRFALGGTWTALWSGPPRHAWVGAAAVAALVAAGSFGASRWSLAHDRGGVLSFWAVVPGLLLLALTLGTSWRVRSFGAGLRAGALAGFAALVAVLAVGIPEAIVWAERRAGYLSTGDAVPPSWEAAVLDVVRPEFLVAMIGFWAIGAVGGAALGTALGRERHGEHVPQKVQ
ncbi:hypothetical protein [Nonomuraea soli]|uniref:Uncharacterized protein n=1 Tax=Nonomuraea soli TaxID=1032476 RepID=A0A7W0HQB9_9ACTN|nr:hypothetical protein [Nonomuraea soli]MBA2891744.1 hypothetical protein [Nonomuraea soli]